ncbi:hypothetical protein SteCoe_34320 [Stentor coeruleus]|uniref:Uncharacterized protein n=1 Tax=Stentor coeruleus TaxID=5963 RepID=A0A1R2AUT2_9CILI|nr:hypothetical protein SteCoe_34320 [Stentor coeruleus]
MWPIESPSTQTRSNSSQSSLSPQSFSLHPECIHYLTCSYCTEPFSDYVYSCSSHPDVKICMDCYRKKVMCFHCKKELQRSLQVEEILGMISIACTICGNSVRMSDYSKHRIKCETRGRFTCAYEIGENKCTFCTEKSEFIYTHYIVDHHVIEYNSLVDSIVLPHAQLHFHPREIEKPFKTVSGLPCYSSVCYLYILNYQGFRVLVEFFYRIPNRSFMFVLRSEKPMKIQLQMLVPRHSVFGISMGLLNDEVEIREGKTISFSDEHPLHMNPNHMIRSICAFEIDIFDMYEKYSLIHGDCRFTQFGFKIVY